MEDISSVAPVRATPNANDVAAAPGDAQNVAMSLAYLDHVNIRTANLSAMTDFYRTVLGLELGPRPGFGFGGAWLYCGDKAAVHLVEQSKTPAGGDPKIEHFAFRAEGLANFVATLQARDIPYTASIVPDFGIRQINIHDPDGNHIEIAFGSHEKADLSPDE